VQWISSSIILILVMFFPPSGVFAQSAAATNGTLARISTGEGGEGLYLNINTLNSACATPVYVNGVQTSPYYFIATNAPQYKETLAMALTAWGLGIPINIIYQTTCNGGNLLTLLAVTYGG
jgi:hypothetical protein